MLDNVRSSVYDTFIVPMTSAWYREVLTRCSPGMSVLDVGIGTATSLLENRDQIRSKRLHFTGVDYDVDYVRKARDGVAKHKLEDHIDIVHHSIHDFSEGPFDVVYFSGSFMIIPNKVTALQRCMGMLRPSSVSGEGVTPSNAAATKEAVDNTASSAQRCSLAGSIIFTQTFEKPTLLGRFVVPMIKWLLNALTTIDFGTVTYEAEFNRTLELAGAEVVTKKVLNDSLFRSQVLIIAKPKH